ncbi:MAG TPA: putative peptide maturation dehydrogenase [Xanthomonadaceae bacterium]|nr:putative peptide maturation dehydrogenase [Xanthomonadaceae bacterium]
MADETRLHALGWHELAAVYHRHTRWSDASGDEATREHTAAAEARRLDEHVARQGPLPPHFVRHNGPLLPLEMPSAGALDTVLRRRETVRRFRVDRVLPRAEFERVLHGSFGVIGLRDLGGGMAAIKRTSPSGGGLTAIEPYVMALRVEGVPSGLYHYRADVHALTLLEALDEAEARQRLGRYCAGQDYFGDSHAAILHLARFDRHFWKYIRHGKAYKAVLMDSAHLSQTLYMLATEAGLGAWYTAIVNDIDIAADLCFDPLEADVVAINGFGIADTERRDLSFHHAAHDPLRVRQRLASENQEA